MKNPVFKRLFIAIPVPKNIQERLFNAHPNIEQPQFKWTPAENMHLTIAFLGKVRIENIAELKQKLKAISEETPTFKLVFNGIRIIFRQKTPTMIWATFLKKKAFVRLSKLLSNTLELELEHEPVPHITLARIKNLPMLPPDYAGYDEVDPFIVRVNRIELWESTLQPKSATYQSIGQFNLKQMASIKA